jgi:hypothetical protein
VRKGKDDVADRSSGHRSNSLTANEFWNEKLATTDRLPYLGTPLDQQIPQLWAMFKGIADHWNLKFEVDLLRSRWLDMLEARSSNDPDYPDYPDYRGEYENAALVFEELRNKHDDGFAVTKIYGKTKVKTKAQATTRLKHAKFYVANHFIRCFIATGGFRGFVPEARNYTGFMGGSRFREWDPVRTGKRK